MARTALASLRSLAATAMIACTSASLAGGVADAPLAADREDAPRARSLAGERGPAVAALRGGAGVPAPTFLDPDLGTPAPATLAADLLGARAATSLGPLDVEHLRSEDRRRRGRPGVPPRIGVVRDIAVGADGPRPLHLGRDGLVAAVSTPERTITTLRIAAPGARAVRVRLATIDLPPGGRLLVGGPADARIETFHGLGPLGSGTAWTGSVAGDEVLLQYVGPDEFGGPFVEIDAIAHAYRLPGDRDAVEGAASSAGGGLLPCHVDVACAEGVDPIARDALGAMNWVDGVDQLVCNGTLLADDDPNTFAGWFMSANHCIDSADEAASIEVFWLWHAETCGGGAGDILAKPRSNGAHLVNTQPSGDFTFMRLLQDPNDGQGFAGSTTEDPVGDVHCLHHPQQPIVPSQAPTKYSRGFRTGEPPVCPERPLERYWYVDWFEGVIQEGSSGGPLFNDDWQFVGQLFGWCALGAAEPACDNPEAYNAVFGKFEYASDFVQAQLVDFMVEDDPYEDNDDLAGAAPLETGIYDMVLADFEDWFRFDMPASGQIAATVRVDPDEPNDPGEPPFGVRVWLRDADGSPIALANGPIATVERDVDAGSYYLQVIKLAGWDATYELEADLIVLGTPCPQDVNGDGLVGFLDLVEILQAWGPCDGCPTDFDDNGLTGFPDLVALLNAWGPCP